MSSATPPAYHLRTNKAVERLLFVELLRKLDTALPKPISRYRYVGLGGPFLEDFKLIQLNFGCLKRMTSLEIDENVRCRQRINKPHSQINLTLTSTGNFVEAFRTANDPMLLWFDHSIPEWKTQISECCDLLPRLPPMSIFKVTLIANPIALGATSDPDPLNVRAEKLSAMFGRGAEFAGNDVTRNAFPMTLFGILRRAFYEAVPDSNERILRPLAAYQYDDGTQVLTVTVMVGPATDVDATIKRGRLSKWPFSNLDWRVPRVIDVPNLSLRERFAVDRLLPGATASRVVKRLKLRLEKSDSDSASVLDRYVQLYRHVPHFLRSVP
jgi:hypothetical protein